MASSTLLYDAECPFCTTAAGMLCVWDREGRITPVALQEADAERLLPDLDAERRMATAHLVLAPDGERYSGGDLFAPLFSRLPGAAPLARLAARFPRASRRLYDVTSSNRSELAKLLPGRLRNFAAERLRRRSA